MSGAARVNLRETIGQAVAQMFDAHVHIIDPRFPLFSNGGFLPHPFTVNDYLQRTQGLPLVGGAVVSASFQGVDQSYLVAALEQLGPSFVGVTQLQATATDEQILNLAEAGVRGVRFNLRRGGSEEVGRLKAFAPRIYELSAWHVELYLNARDLGGLRRTLLTLPALSVAHLGLSKAGFGDLLALVEQGVRVKASGFGRVDLEVKTALRDLHAAHPEALMFGTDLPSTRAPRPYTDEDAWLILEALGEHAAQGVFFGNALKFYHPQRLG